MKSYEYVGSELALFAAARNWKCYLRSQLRTYIGAHVLEVGAGQGATTKALCPETVRLWVCLEPDPGLAQELSTSIREGKLPLHCVVLEGTSMAVRPGPWFDTILYVDVLEHIEDDRAELCRSVECLAPRGHLIVLAPAHQWLFTAFDQSIGHFRRYTKQMLTAVTPHVLTLVRLVYLDAAGFLASAGNKLLLRSPMPSASQIAIWDRILVPISRIIDPLLGFKFGKSVLAVWQRADASFAGEPNTLPGSLSHK